LGYRRLFPVTGLGTRPLEEAAFVEPELETASLEGHIENVTDFAEDVLRRRDRSWMPCW